MESYPSAQSFFQKEHFVNTRERLLENRNWTFPVVGYFKWKLEIFSNILSIVVSGNNFLLLTCPGPLQTSFSDNFGNSKVFNIVLA